MAYRFHGSGSTFYYFWFWFHGMNAREKNPRNGTTGTRTTGTGIQEPRTGRRNPLPY